MQLALILLSVIPDSDRESSTSAFWIPDQKTTGMTFLVWGVVYFINEILKLIFAVSAIFLLKF